MLPCIDPKNGTLLRRKADHLELACKDMVQHAGWLSIHKGNLVGSFPGLFRAEAQTVMFLSIEGRPAGIISVADRVKESTAEAISLLHDAKVHQHLR